MAQQGRKQRSEGIHLQTVSAPVEQQLDGRPIGLTERTGNPAQIRGLLLHHHRLLARPDRHQGGTSENKAVGQLQRGRVPQHHMKGGHHGPVGRGRREQRLHPQLLQLLLVHPQHPLPIRVRQLQALQRPVVGDDLVEQEVSRRGGDQGTYRPHHPLLQPAVGVEQFGHAPIVVTVVILDRLVGGGGGRGRRGGDGGGGEDDAGIEGGAEVGRPLEEDALVHDELAGGKLDPEPADLVESPEHLGGRVVGDVRG